MTDISKPAASASIAALCSIDASASIQPKNVVQYSRSKTDSGSRENFKSPGASAFSVFSPRPVLKFHKDLKNIISCHQ